MVLIRVSIGCTRNVIKFSKPGKQRSLKSIVSTINYYIENINGQNQKNQGRKPYFLRKSYLKTCWGDTN